MTKKAKTLFNPDDFKLDISTDLEIPVIPEVRKEPAPAPKVEKPAAPKAAKQKDPAKKAMPLYLTDEQYAYLSYKARRSKQTMVQLIRSMIDEDIQQNPDIAAKSKDFL